MKRPAALFFRVSASSRFARTFAAAVGCLSLAISGCRNVTPPEGPPEKVKVVATAYCSCKKCTGWKRNWFFRPVYASGPNKGLPKKVGQTADGTPAKKGVIAADTRFYPFGTVFRIPGYGYAAVHDRGSHIKGPYRIDLYFPSHEQALKWGRKRLVVDVWKTTGDS